MRKFLLVACILPIIGYGQYNWYNLNHKVILMDKDYNVLYQNLSNQIKNNYVPPGNTEYYLRWSSKDSIAILLKKKENKKYLGKYKWFGKGWLENNFDVASAGKISKLNLEDIISSTYSLVVMHIFQKGIYGM